jgi:hypothetical protein
MKEKENGRKEISSEEEGTFRYSAKIESGGDGPEPVHLDGGMYYFRGGAGHYKGRVMWGLLENSKDIGMVDNMSLESAHTMWRQGGLRNVLAIYAANNRPCECGNPAEVSGLSCFNSAHGQMREEMRQLKIVAER